MVIASKAKQKVEERTSFFEKKEAKKLLIVPGL